MSQQKELEDKIQKKASETSELPGITRKHGENFKNEYSDSDLLADLKLIEFLDIDLKPTFDLRVSIKDGTIKAIDYPDLWHLFELGEDVITQSSRVKIFRVVSFTVC